MITFGEFPQSTGYNGGPIAEDDFYPFASTLKKNSKSEFDLGFGMILHAFGDGSSLSEDANWLIDDAAVYVLTHDEVTLEASQTQRLKSEALLATALTMSMFRSVLSDSTSFDEWFFSDSIVTPQSVRTAFLQLVEPIEGYLANYELGNTISGLLHGPKKNDEPRVLPLRAISSAGALLGCSILTAINDQRISLEGEA